MEKIWHYYQELMEHPLPIWGLYFSVPLCSYKKRIAWSIHSAIWRSFTLSSPCFQRQVLVTSVQQLLVLEDHLVTYMGWVGWSQPRVHTKNASIPYLMLATNPTNIFGCEVKNLPRYFLPASRLVFRQGSIWKLTRLQQPLPALRVPANWLGLHVCHQL